jgi:hypothetical protein
MSFALRDYEIFYRFPMYNSTKFSNNGVTFSEKTLRTLKEKPCCPGHDPFVCRRACAWYIIESERLRKPKILKKAKATQFEWPVCKDLS